MQFVTRLTREQFEAILREKHGAIWRGVWLNYPNSMFYYDRPDFDGTSENIGIYTSPYCYSLGPA